ncbi:MAG: type II toxin-antitoxin system HicB family antitoxin [Reyranellaceae bacterium]
MKGYWAFVYEEDGQYWGLFPELKGCYTAADDITGLAANLIEALGLWIESQESANARIPAPRSLPEVLKIRVEAGKPQAVQFVPLLPPADRAKQVAMSVDERKLEIIDEAAGRLGQSRSAFMVNAALAAAASLGGGSVGKARRRARSSERKRA